MAIDLTHRDAACDLGLRYALKGKSAAELARVLRKAGADTIVVIDAQEAYYFAVDNLLPLEGLT